MREHGLVPQRPAPANVGSVSRTRLSAVAVHMAVFLIWIERASWPSSAQPGGGRLDMSKLLRVAAILSLIAPAFAPGTRAAESEAGQPSYINCEYGFAIIFPRPPMTRDVRYTTSTGATVPARQFYLENGADRLMVTVATFTGGPIIDEKEMDHAAATLSMR